MNAMGGVRTNVRYKKPKARGPNPLSVKKKSENKRSATREGGGGGGRGRGWRREEEEETPLTTTTTTRFRDANKIARDARVVSRAFVDVYNRRDDARPPRWTTRRPRARARRGRPSVVHISSSSLDDLRSLRAVLYERTSGWS